MEFGVGLLGPLPVVRVDHVDQGLHPFEVMAPQRAYLILCQEGKGGKEGKGEREREKGEREKGEREKGEGGKGGYDLIASSHIPALDSYFLVIQNLEIEACSLGLEEEEGRREEGGGRREEGGGRREEGRGGSREHGVGRRGERGERGEGRREGNTYCWDDCLYFT